MSISVRHPAKFSDEILIALQDYVPERGKKVFDPFSGTGKLGNIVQSEWLYLNEIEYIWAYWGKPANVTVADTLILPYSNNIFDIICTSPTYGNRMADHHNARDNSIRNTYTHALGRKLHNNNSGQMQWGNSYKEFHKKAWKECIRVLKHDGLFVLNISNHIRKGKEIFVSEWHLEILKKLGLFLLEWRKVKTPRNRNGENANLRVEYENIYILKYP